MRRNTLRSAKSRWSGPSSSGRNAKMESALRHQAMCLRAQDRTQCIDMALTAGPSRTPKCQTLTARIRRRRACSARQVCSAWAARAATCSISHRSNSPSTSRSWATSSQIKTSTMVSRTVPGSISLHSKSFLVTITCRHRWMPFQRRSTQPAAGWVMVGLACRSSKTSARPTWSATGSCGIQIRTSDQCVKA